MLEPYRLKKHPIHGAQSFVNHLFLQVILKAPKLRGTFSSALVQVPRYRKLIDEVNPDYMLHPLQKIYTLCANLPPEHIKTLKRAVLINNRIRELCGGKFTPVLYSDLEAIDKDLSETIRYFCIQLYKNVINLAPFHRTFGSIEEYYRQLVGRKRACRFCRIDSVQTEFEPNRSPFDHYLTKSLYPFTSLNFRNLVPICEKCNGNAYKGKKNILYNEDKKTPERVKAFYPFRYHTPSIQLSFKFRNPYKADYEPTDFDLTLRCDEAPQETDTWNRIFQIEKRYKAFCCSDEMLAIVENQFLAWKSKGMTPNKYLDALRRAPTAGQNFITIPFLEEVKSIYRNEVKE